MSYDVSLMIQTGPNNWVTVIDDFNYTSNLGELFIWAYGKHFGEALDHKSAQEVSRILNKAISAIESEPTENLQEFDPENKWGDWHSFLEFLREIRNACNENPYCTVRVWW